MPRLTPTEMLIANLRGDFPEGAIGHMPREQAHQELVALAGIDLGTDAEKWEQWLKEQRTKQPSKTMTRQEISVALRKRRAGG
ncbi:MAG: hypothetical protein GX552_16455 [Chloroflexi bacterium]|nr:hypothetical protein [Chloroflexota bacterium]